MNDKTKYLNAWKEAVAQATEALKSGDMEAADKFYEKMEKAYDKYKEVVSFEDSMKDAQFATINTTLESVLPSLFAKKGKLLKECINMIKGDKNLLTQFRLYHALTNYNGKTDANRYIEEAWDLASKDINLKTLNESNKKLSRFLVKNNLQPLQEVSEQTQQFNESFDSLVRSKKKLNNLGVISENIENIAKYITENAKQQKQTKNVDVFKIAEAVEKKMNLLNEEEWSLVSDIMAVKNPQNEEKKRNLFNKMKTECIEKINGLLPERESVEKEKLLSIKETLMLKEYNPDTVVKDVAKLLEIGSILSDT